MPVPFRLILSLRQYRLNRVLSLFGFLLVLYNEWLSYSLYSWSWSSLPEYEDTDLVKSNETKQIKILLVADPQLVGLQDEHWLFGSLTRWDCDRYLFKGYSRAYAHVDPTLVVFLGDLIDEGSKADEEEFQSYVTRFNNIFEVPHNVKAVYAAGDNDVGGEGFDRKQSSKLDRFFQNVPVQPQKTDDIATKVQFVTFIRLSYDQGETVDENQLKRMKTLRKQIKSEYRVVCNHMPITTRYGDDHKKVLRALHPNVIFSAHTHMGAIARCSMCRDTEDEKMRRQLKQFLGDIPETRIGRRTLGRGHWSGDQTPTGDWSVHAIDMDDPYILHEIIVPTCSYRMGVPDMGYGYATIDADGILRYTVLWLPGRYTQLYSYLTFIVISVVFVSLSNIFRRILL